MNETYFNTLIEGWIKHCKQPEVEFSSSGIPVRENCYYRELAKGGKEILPYVRSLYDLNNRNFAFEIIKAHGLPSLVKDIVGEDLVIPTEIHGHVSSIENYVKNWLDLNLDKYKK